MKTDFVRDVPVGILLIVIAQFFLYGVMYFSKWPNILEFFGIIVLVMLSDRTISFGIDLIRGVAIKIEDE